MATKDKDVATCKQIFAISGHKYASATRYADENDAAAGCALRVFQTSLNQGCHPDQVKSTLKPNIAPLPPLHSGAGFDPGVRSHHSDRVKPTQKPNIAHLTPLRSGEGLGGGTLSRPSTPHSSRVIQLPQAAAATLKPNIAHLPPLRSGGGLGWGHTMSAKNYEGNTHNTQPDPVLYSSCRLKSTRHYEQRSKRGNPVIRWRCCTFGNSMISRLQEHQTIQTALAKAKHQQ